MSPEVFFQQQVTEEERLEILMRRRLGTRIRNLRVRLQAAGVVLQGRSSSYYVKQLAQHAAMELSSTPLLANDIEVEYQAAASSQPWI